MDLWGFQFGFDGLENLGPDFPPAVPAGRRGRYLSAVLLAD
jgi:hypothetical protein